MKSPAAVERQRRLSDKLFPAEFRNVETTKLSLIERTSFLYSCHDKRPSPVWGRRLRRSHQIIVVAVMVIVAIVVVAVAVAVAVAAVAAIVAVRLLSLDFE